MASSFNYSIASDTANGALAQEKMHQEIASSSITISITGVNVSGDSMTVVFATDISAGEETILDGLVSSHDGIAGPDDPQKVIVESNQPFAAKTLANGKKLYARTHGKAFSVSSGTNTLTFDIPYAACKLTGIELINGEAGDYIDMYVLDDSSGTYSTVPNYVLNQFGFNAYVSKDFYRKESAYDADLYINMVLKVEYNSQSSKDVYINYLLHEVKD